VIVAGISAELRVKRDLSGYTTLTPFPITPYTNDPVPERPPRVSAARSALVHFHGICPKKLLLFAPCTD